MTGIAIYTKYVESSEKPEADECEELGNDDPRVSHAEVDIRFIKYIILRSKSEPMQSILLCRIGNFAAIKTQTKEKKKITTYSFCKILNLYP